MVVWSGGHSLQLVSYARNFLSSWCVQQKQAENIIVMSNSVFSTVNKNKAHTVKKKINKAHTVKKKTHHKYVICVTCMDILLTQANNRYIANPYGGLCCCCATIRCIIPHISAIVALEPQSGEACMRTMGWSS